MALQNPAENALLQHLFSQILNLTLTSTPPLDLWNLKFYK